MKAKRKRTVSDAQLCKELIKIIPHAGAPLIANGSDGYALVECHRAFDSLFGIDWAKASDVVSAIQAHEKNGSPQAQSGYNILFYAKMAGSARKNRR